MKIKYLDKEHLPPNINGKLIENEVLTNSKSEEYTLEEFINMVNNANFNIVNYFFALEKNNEEATINKIALASELAEMILIKDWSKDIKIYKKENATITEYTPEAQDIFNKLYDEFLNIIEANKIK